MIKAIAFTGSATAGQASCASPPPAPNPFPATPRWAGKLQGHLTATIHGTEADIANAHGLSRILESKVGRILFNGYPTGVEVCHAMVYGGPFPATSDGRSTYPCSPA